MLMQLSRYVNFVRCVNSTAAGTTNITGTHVDMQGYDGVMFVLAVGALTATQVTNLQIQGGNQSNDSDQANLSMQGVGVAVGDTNVISPNLLDTQSNFLVVVDVLRPYLATASPRNMRYVRPVVNRGTANAAVDGVFAFLYRTSKRPTVANTTYVASATVFIG